LARTPVILTKYFHVYPQSLQAKTGRVGLPPPDLAIAKSCLDLSSDHSPVLITLTTHAMYQEKKPSLSNRHTNWDYFRHLINQRLTLNVPLRTEEDIEAAVKSFNDTVQWAGWNATPEHTEALKT
jgi:hypothetical protein